IAPLEIWNLEVLRQLHIERRRPWSFAAISSGRATVLSRKALADATGRTRRQRSETGAQSGIGRGIRVEDERSIVRKRVAVYVAADDGCERQSGSNVTEQCEADSLRREQSALNHEMMSHIEIRPGPLPPQRGNESRRVEAARNRSH